MNMLELREKTDGEQYEKIAHRLMSGTELAQYCGVSKKFISKHTAAGRFPGVVRVGRLLHYDRQIIDRRIAVGKLLLEKQEKV
jgi:predicted DNA-binding transcriptional regulator AlpA